MGKIHNKYKPTAVHVLSIFFGLSQLSLQSHHSTDYIDRWYQMIFCRGMSPTKSLAAICFPWNVGSITGATSASSISHRSFWRSIQMSLPSGSCHPMDAVPWNLGLKGVERLTRLKSKWSTSHWVNSFFKPKISSDFWADISPMTGPIPLQPKINLALTSTTCCVNGNRSDQIMSNKKAVVICCQPKRSVLLSDSSGIDILVLYQSTIILAFSGFLALELMHQWLMSAHTCTKQIEDGARTNGAGQDSKHTQQLLWYVERPFDLSRISNLLSSSGGSFPNSTR